MEFRKLVIAAVILVLMVAGGLAAFQIADYARGESAQNQIDRDDQLAVNSGIVQKLVSDDDHTPTRYADSIEVTYNETAWNESEQYAYYPENGSIEFLIDEDDPANVSYTYFIPENEVADGQLQTLTVSTGLLARLGVAMTFVVLFLFIGAFVAKRMRANNSGGRGR